MRKGKSWQRKERKRNNLIKEYKARPCEENHRRQSPSTFRCAWRLTDFITKPDQTFPVWKMADTVNLNEGNHWVKRDLRQTLENAYLFTKQFV